MSRLSRESIARAAIEVADSDGVEAVSMRGVAKHLDVGTMSLYHYVRDKSDLITVMADAIIAAQVIPDDELPEGWRDGLAEIGRRAHALFTDHRWILASWHSVDRGEPGVNFLRHIEQTLAIISELDFLSIEERMEITGLVDEYAFGHSMNVAYVEDMGPMRDKWMARLTEIAAGGDYPHITEAFGEMPEGRPPPGADFERGLQILLDGIELHVERRRAAAAAR